METAKYLELIQIEVNKLPDFVKQFNLGTNHSLTTTYQYLTEIRRFFDWLRQENISSASDNAHVTTDTLANLRRNDIMLYIDYLGHTRNKQGRLNSPTTINRSINALRSLFKFLTITADNNHGEPYFERNVMLKINSLNDTQTLNYRAHVLESHMYTGKLKFEFLTFIDSNPTLFLFFISSICNFNYAIYFNSTNIFFIIERKKYFNILQILFSNSILKLDILHFLFSIFLIPLLDYLNFVLHNHLVYLKIH